MRGQGLFVFYACKYNDEGLNQASFSFIAKEKYVYNMFC